MVCQPEIDTGPLKGGTPRWPPSLSKATNMRSRQHAVCKTRRAAYIRRVEADLGYIPHVAAKDEAQK